MTTQPIIMVVDPAHFNVSYVINPWMRPGEWADDPEGHQREARASFDALCGALEGAGAKVEITPGVAGQPDMVFPANAAVVLDRRAIVARFACAERQGEEQPYLAALQSYVAKGLLDEVSIFPEGCFQEGAGDAIWDRTRQRPAQHSARHRGTENLLWPRRGAAASGHAALLSFGHLLLPAQRRRSAVFPAGVQRRIAGPHP
jgi:N-dimethylarginine dimethylaminohydrolase